MSGEALSPIIGLGCNTRIVIVLVTVSVLLVVAVLLIFVTVYRNGDMNPNKKMTS